MKTIKDLPGGVYTVDKPWTKADIDALLKSLKERKNKREKSIKRKLQVIIKKDSIKLGDLGTTGTKVPGLAGIPKK